MSDLSRLATLQRIWWRALIDLLILLPWTYAGAVVIDGYWVPYYKRLLGLL